MATSFPGSLKGREDERPWERGCGNGGKKRDFHRAHAHLISAFSDSFLFYLSKSLS